MALSNRVGVQGSDSSVKKLMTLLRKSGFSSSEISELSGGKWSSTLVRQYTRGWGEVDEELDEQRKSMIGYLRELVSSKKGIDDVEHVLALDRSVMAKGSSLEEVAELNSNITNLDVQPGEIGKLVSLSREMLEKNLSIDTVLHWMKLDQELIDDGFNKATRLQIRTLCEKFGGIYKTFEAINMFNSLTEIMNLYSQFNDEVKRLRAEKDELDEEVNQNKSIINEVNITKFLGFDSTHLHLLSVLVKPMGGPLKALEAVQKYGSLNEINVELEAKKLELDRAKNELATNKQEIAAIKYSLDEARTIYKKNRAVQLAVNLIVNPRKIRMNNSEIIWVLSQVLDGSLRKIDEGSEALDIPDPRWEVVHENIKALSEQIHYHIENHADA